jgi:hypothetical protein
LAGESQLHSEGISKKASKQSHEHTRPQVLQTDDLVVQGEDIFTPETGGAVVIARHGDSF